VPFAGSHGHLDATSDPAVIAEIAQRDGLWAMATGAVSGIDVVDRDLKQLPDGTSVWGGDSLGDAGLGYFLDTTPTVKTPRGEHQWYRHPAGVHVKSGPLVVEDQPVPAVDIKGDGGYVVLPPGPGRSWDPVLGPDTPLADLPAYAVMTNESVTTHQATRPPPAGADFTCYGEAAMDGIVANILQAPFGEQESAINGGAYAMGQLAAGGEVGTDFAIATIDWLGGRIPSLDSKRPWRSGALFKKLRAAFVDGMRHPRSAR
jgi:hypothetical protein